MRAPALRVPRELAEGVRQHLMDADLLRVDLKIKRADDAVYFPLVHATPVDAYPLTEVEFEAQSRVPRGFHEFMPEAIRALAPSAFDVIGHVAIVKIPADARDHAPVIGEAILRAVKTVRTVCVDDGVVGEFRVRALKVIAGGPETLTECREHGLRYRIDPATAYFSPRLGTERARVAALVEDGERVVDLFAGVGPWALMIGKTGRPERVDAVDLNPEAVARLRENIVLNHLEDTVHPHLGDARSFCRDPEHAHRADRVIMNVPHTAADFIEDALRLVKTSGGVIHHHAILDAMGVDAHVAALAARASTVGRTIELASRRIVRAYSPQENHFALDLRVRPS